MPTKLARLTLLLFSLGTILAVTDSNGADEVRVISQTGHRTMVAATALIPEHGLVLSGGSFDNVVVVWDAQSGEVLQRINVSARVLQIVPIPNSTRVWVWVWSRDLLIESSGKKNGLPDPVCYDAITGEEVSGPKQPSIDPRLGAEEYVSYGWGGASDAQVA